jgi:hypothetical protein
MAELWKQNWKQKVRLGSNHRGSGLQGNRNQDGHLPLRQPQDGSPAESRTISLESRRFPALAGEPEDARLTGETRSLARRLSALNLGLRPLLTQPVQPKSSQAAFPTALQTWVA